MTGRITYLLLGSAFLAGFAGACGSNGQNGSAFDGGGNVDGTSGNTHDAAQDSGGKPGKDGGIVLNNPDVHQPFDSVRLKHLKKICHRPR